jgi:RNA polymerase sigma-70 factor (ECF subfamily)
MLAFYLALAADSDKSLLEQLYIRYRNLMLTKAYEILGEPTLAEDAVHEAFMRIMKNTSKLDAADSPRTKGYVMIVVENAAKTIYAKNHRQKIIELDENMADNSDVSDRIESKMQAEMLADVIARLPDRYREILLLRYLHGLSDKEISSSLSITQQTVRKRLERARNALKKHLGGEFYG